MKLFEQLGRSLEEKWRGSDYDETLLPDLAAAGLDSFDLLSGVTPEEIIKWTISTDCLPLQRDPNAGFGDPPITLFNAPRFHIDAYFWLNGTTSIHQHAFTGAFQVLSGSSIHSRYSFEEREQISTLLRTGDMSLESCELLESGAIQKILPGRQYIHSLFHLDQPSVTIVVRTHSIPLEMPQFEYYKPGLAIDPFFESTDLEKKIQTLQMSVRAGFENADKYIEETLESADFHTAFLILSRLRNDLQAKSLRTIFELETEGDRFERLLQYVCGKHERNSELLRRVFEGFTKTDILVRLRNVITDPEHRFFLALLLNLENRQQIFELTKSRFPDSDPIEKVLDWVSDLVNTRMLDGSFPNGLAIEGLVDFDTVVLEEILGRKTDAELIESLKSENVTEKLLRESIDRLRNAPVLEALMS